MARFEIEQYELHVMTYQVEADTHAEAIIKLLEGHGEPLDDTLEFVETCYDRGVAVDSVSHIAAKLRLAGIEVGDVLPSIREVYQY